MATETKIRRIHGEPIPVNVPDDMTNVPPIPCSFKVGDAVEYTNEYGAKFNHVVRGFARESHGQGRFVYVFKDAWWFPVNPENLKLK